LLVVIGIIALLISILLPVMGRVRQQAIATECLTRLKDMGNAFNMYVSANKNTFPPGRFEKNRGEQSVFSIGDVETYRPRWYEIIGAQVGKIANKNPKPTEDDTWTIDDKWFLCGAVPEWTNSRNYVFGYNYQFLGNARPKGSHTAWADANWINYPVRVTKIPNAAGTVMAADSMGTAAGKPTSQRQRYYNDGTKDPDGWGNKGWCLDPPRLKGNSDYADPERRNPNDRSGPHARHMKKVNVVFVDGHAALMTLEDLGYVVSPDGAIGANTPGAHNRMFSGTGKDDDPPGVD
jgi:prepilin-type processing-associated H-X9-DG protein